MRTKSQILFVWLICSFPTFAQTWDDVTIYTPNGSSVSALKFTSGELSSSQKQDYKDFWIDYYDNRITFLSEATQQYNCHAFSWYVYEGGSYVWLNTPNDDKYWNDGSYLRVYNETEGLKVSFGSCYGYHCFDYNKNGRYDYDECDYYDACDHSAITTTTTGYFISKWGPGPLFRHYKTDCPYSHESGLRYYKLSSNSCREYYENKTISSNSSKSGCILLVKNVKVQNNANLIIDASNYTQISGPFEIGLGSTLTVK